MPRWSDDEYLAERFLRPYFPPAIAGALPPRVSHHSLRRELIATRAVNQMVDIAGAVFIFNLDARLQRRNRKRRCADGSLRRACSSYPNAAEQIRNDSASSPPRPISRRFSRWPRPPAIGSAWAITA